MLLFPLPFSHGLALKRVLNRGKEERFTCMDLSKLVHEKETRTFLWKRNKQKWVQKYSIRNSLWTWKWLFIFFFNKRVSWTFHQISYFLAISPTISLLTVNQFPGLSSPSSSFSLSPSQPLIPSEQPSTTHNRLNNISCSTEFRSTLP